MVEPSPRVRMFRLSLRPRIQASRARIVVDLDAQDRVASADGRHMKVFEGLSGGVEPGTALSVAALGLPVQGTNGVLLVFWKST